MKTLQQPGPYTVFAPTDAAFKKVPKATLNALLKDKAKLKAVLLYHVVAGKVTAKEVVTLSRRRPSTGRPSDPGRRLERVRQQRKGDEGRRDGNERRHPRRQPRPHPRPSKPPFLALGACGSGAPSRLPETTPSS